MSLFIRTASVAVIAMLAAASQTAWAAEPITGTSIDSTTFRPGHPASPRWVLTRSGQEHPGVLAARAGARSGIDPNVFTVQPPASVRWTLAAEPAALVAVSVR